MAIHMEFFACMQIEDVMAENTRSRAVLYIMHGAVYCQKHSKVIVRSQTSGFDTGGMRV
jgi:hypothetical protein